MTLFLAILYIFIFGCIGSLLRFIFLTNFKSGLLISNCLGVFLALLIFPSNPIFVTGFCGSLTTFSALIKKGFSDLNYLFLTVFVCFSISLIFSLI